MNNIFDCCYTLLLLQWQRSFGTRWQPVTLKVCIAAVAFLTSGLASLCVASFSSPWPLCWEKRRTAMRQMFIFLSKASEDSKKSRNLSLCEWKLFQRRYIFFHVANKMKYKTKWSQIRVTKRPPYHSGWLWGSGGGSLSSLRPVVERFWIQTRKLLT